jgi:hypothetical protein
VKLAHKLAVAALLLSGAAQVQAGDPIPGVDVMLPNGGGKAATSAISDQAQGGVLTRTTTAKLPENNSPIPSDRKAARRGGEPTDPNDGSGGKAAPRAISDQAQGGVLTSYGKGTSGGTVPPGPRPGANAAMQDVSTTRKTSAGSPINWGDGAPKAVAGKISDNESPRPTDRLLGKEAGKPAAPAIVDRWGSYSAGSSASRTASPQKDAERNPAQSLAAAREKYNAQSASGSPGAPTPLMNGPNAGLPSLTPALGPAMPMSPGVMSPGGH